MTELTDARVGRGRVDVARVPRAGRVPALRRAGRGATSRRRPTPTCAPRAASAGCRPAGRGRGRHRRRAADLQLQRAALQRPGAVRSRPRRRPPRPASRRGSTSTSRPPPSGTCRAPRPTAGDRAAAASRRLERRGRRRAAAAPQRRLDPRPFICAASSVAAAAGYALALGVVGAVVLGAWLRSPLVMLGRAAGGWSSLVLRAALRARRRARGARVLPQLLAGARAALRGRHRAAAADAAARSRRSPRMPALDGGAARRAACRT